MVWYATDPIESLSYDEAVAEFEWDLPQDYTAAEDLVRKHEDKRSRVALLQGYPDGRRERYTFHDLDSQSNQLANGLEDIGVGQGDCVAILATQTPQTLLTHLACWKIGAISIPLSVLFGEDALEYRLQDSGTKVLVVDDEVTEKVERIEDVSPDLEAVLAFDGLGPSGAKQFEDVRRSGSRRYEIDGVDKDTPFLMVYTSGTTGDPKGVLHTQKNAAAQAFGFNVSYNRDVGKGDVVWTHADWAWMNGPHNFIGALHHGRPIVGYPLGKFEPEPVYSLLEEFEVSKAFLAPTALRMMMNVDDPAEQFDLRIDAIVSGGEALTSEIREWAGTQLEGAVINEIFGQTEGSPFVCTCENWFETKVGSMGKPVPGQDVAIVGQDTAEELPPEDVGMIAVRREDDPLVFEEYWNKPEKTAEVTVDGWHYTDDLGYYDEDGYFWYESRADDVITTSGYRVGPTEVEETILQHPDVEQVGVIGVPDETRGEIVKAFVQTVPGVEGSETLEDEIEDLVRNHLAQYEYPREIEFWDELPKTTTGKVRRVDLREYEGIE